MRSRSSIQPCNVRARRCPPVQGQHNSRWSSIWSCYPNLETAISGFPEEEDGREDVSLPAHLKYSIPARVCSSTIFKPLSPPTSLSWLRSDPIKLSIVPHPYFCLRSPLLLCRPPPAPSFNHAFQSHPMVHRLCVERCKPRVLRAMPDGRILLQNKILIRWKLRFWSMLHSSCAPNLWESVHTCPQHIFTRCCCATQKKRFHVENACMYHMFSGYKRN